jgi:peptidylprolyl isomerase
MATVINVTDDGKVKKEIIREGTGAQPKKGDKVEVHYVGTLESDGSKFDSSRDKGEPFSFEIGTGVIKGWSLGVVTMKVGELAKFTIDAEYGYGDAGSGEKIPGGATLIFEIELLRIVPSYKNDDEAMAATNDLCARAAAAFKTADFDGALSSYLEAQSILKSKYGKKFDDIKLRVDRNLAITYGKLANWRESLTYAEKVLKKEAADPRSLLRKSEAHLQLDQFDEARKALDKGAALTKSDAAAQAAFASLRAKLHEAEKQDRIRQAAVFKKMVAPGTGE